MDVADVRRLRELEGENGKLKKLLVDTMLDIAELKVARAPTEMWSIDFVSDSFEYGRALQCRTIVDEYTKEAIDNPVDDGISGEYVTRVLNLVSRFRDLPQMIRTDQGPELIDNARGRWVYRNRVTLRLTQAGKLTQNPYVERFNGKLRDECLDEHWFRLLVEAREIIAAWRTDCNQRRPHNSFGYHASAEFAAAWRCRHAGHARQDASTKGLFTNKSLTNCPLVLKRAAAQPTGNTQACWDVRFAFGLYHQNGQLIPCE
jgi:putative transposase